MLGRVYVYVLIIQAEYPYINSMNKPKQVHKQAHRIQKKDKQSLRNNNQPPQSTRNKNIEEQQHMIPVEPPNVRTESHETNSHKQTNQPTCESP